MAYTVVSAALVLFMSVGTMSQNIARDQQLLLDGIVRDVMRCAEIPSLSIAFTYPDRNISYTGAFGRHTHSSNRNATTQTAFCIGGATQAFTAVLLAKLLDKHPNVTWDTPLRDIVNHRIELPYQYMRDNLNLKDIFAMRSGLAGMDILTVARPFGVDELIEKLRYAPPVAGFREKTINNEVLFSLLEEVVQVLGNDTWQNLIRRHILEPLKMRSTTFIGPASHGNIDVAQGAVQHTSQLFYLQAESYSGLELAAPAVSVCTSADDMLKWLNFLLNDGKVGYDVIVDKAALAATHERIQLRGKNADPVLQSFREATVRDDYSRDGSSLGWINGFYRGFPFVSQDGSIPGYQALATIVPSQKVGVYVAFNGDHDDKRVAAKVLLNVLGIDFFIRDRRLLGGADICSTIKNVSDFGRRRKAEDKQWTIQRAKTSFARPLEEYVGTYKNYAFGDVEVNTTAPDDDNKDGGLVLKYGLAEYKLMTTNRNNTFKLWIQTGDLWYSTNADLYRDGQQMFAEFFSDSQEEEEEVDEQRFTSVKIHGFDRHYTPEFSRNARPPHYERYSDYNPCSASVRAAWQWTVLLVIIIMHFS